MLTAGSLASAARIILIPVDNRPATGQFAQMIGAMGGVQVDLPPDDILGKFTTPGNPEKVLDWLENQDFSNVMGVIVSTDMVAYGSLIASRTYQTDDQTAVNRIKRLIQIRKKHKATPFYGFSTLTRISPTVTRETMPWYISLIEYVRLRSTKPNAKEKQQMAEYLAKIPTGIVEAYDAMRARNVRINKQIIRFAAKGGFDYLILGQDDAAVTGPQIKEAKAIKAEIDKYQAQEAVQFCEGIDQHCLVLVSKAILDYLHIKPKLRVIYSDDQLSHNVGLYETRPLRDTLLDQVIASGAQIIQEGEPFDYTLYVALPNTDEAKMQTFNDRIVEAAKNNEKVAVANIDLQRASKVSKSLEKTLSQKDVAPKLLAFATWNSPSNTTGTTIPAANMTVTADKIETGKLYKEMSRVAFLLHRFVGDLDYHYRTRPAVYQYATEQDSALGRVEFLPHDVDKMNAFVQDHLGKLIVKTFNKSFKGATIQAGDLELKLRSLEGLSIQLPWWRAFEVRVDFHLIFI